MARWFGAVSMLALTIGCGAPEHVIVPAPLVDEPIKAATPVSAPVAKPTAQVAGDDESWGIRGESAPDHAAVIEKVTGMIHDQRVVSGARRRGLSLVNVMWEDTGRAEGSSLGPNISDLTLEVRRKDERGRFVSALMPVIRFPNFADRTGDVPADKFFVRVGNERPDGGRLRSVALTDVLRDLKSFASMPSSIKGSGNLLAARDTHFLVSAQAVFLPIPKSGKAEFNPVLFNYQSSPGSPAVLSILITREGTSVSVIENRSEDQAGGGRGQEIYFNNKGQRAAFTAERKSDVVARIEAQGGPKTEEDRSALAKGADVLFLVQVPLVHANHGVIGGAMMGPPPPTAAKAGSAAPAGAPQPKRRPLDQDRSDVEQAVLGHGPNLGPYNEGRDLRLQRDPKFPIRITVQFYKATSNGVADDEDLDAIAKSIGSVYEHAAFVGSLVLPEGDARRPTEWQKIPGEWFPW